MKIECIFSDLDRTLLNAESRISEENKKAIERLCELGIPFVPATGRAIGSIPEGLLDIKGIDYCITSNGVCVFDIHEKKPLVRKYLPTGFIADFFSFCEERDLIAVEVYYDGKAYVPYEFYEDPLTYNQPRVQYVKETRTPVDDLKKFALEKDGEIESVCIISPNGMLEELSTAAKECFKDEYVTVSDSLYVEIASKECGKHNGMKAVCELLGIDIKNTVAFGDNDNDIEMLQAAGIGICVENATDNCKSAADMVTESNVCDGVARAIQRLLEEK